MNRNVLLLNSSEEVLRIINWKHAVKLLEGGKAKKPFGYNKNYDIKTSSGVYKLFLSVMFKYRGEIHKFPPLEKTFLDEMIGHVNIVSTNLKIPKNLQWTMFILNVLGVVINGQILLPHVLHVMSKKPTTH